MRRIAFAIAALFVGAIAAANLIVLRAAAGGPKTERDCILVLGAGVKDDGTPSDVLRDRLDEAIALHHPGDRILVSGDHRTVSYDEPNAMRRYLEAHGIAAADIVMDHAGFDTYSSIWRAKNVFGARRVVVVTQRFHLARAVWVARELGMDAEGSAADRRVYRGMAWLEVREVFSRTKAFFDVAVARKPRFPA